MQRKHPHFHDIRTHFEPRSSLPAFIKRLAGNPKSTTNPNMAEQQQTILGEPSKPLILQSSNHNSWQPSWIGPPPAARQHEFGTMKQNVKITYFSAGLQPPVYIVTSLSEPQWQPIEMESEKEGESDLRFSKSFEVEEGEYQYKFRLGPGDWWVHDEDKPTVDDGFGNKNNTLVVSEQKQPKTDSGESALSSSVAADAVQSKEGNEVEKEELPEEAPLLRHESLSPDSHEQEQAPLFRHESTSIENKHSISDIDLPLEMATHAPRTSVEDHVAPEPGRQDVSTLETFPTDRDGIMASIRRASASLPEDETAADVASSPPPKPHSTTSPGASTQSLPSLEQGVEDLKKIAEGDEEDTADVQADMPVDDAIGKQAEHPTAPMTPPMTPKDEHAPAPSPDDVAEESTTKKNSLSMDKESVSSSSLAPFLAFGEWLIRLCGGKANAV